MPLPKIMVAPNGARRNKADHPALPITIAETVTTARACFAAGATGIHAHIRDGDGQHVLDAGPYRELISELQNAVPEMMVQITSEAVGRYTPAEQIAVITDTVPKAVSVALSELAPDADTLPAATRFYHWAGEAQIDIQHILYRPQEITRLAALLADRVIPDRPLQMLFVLGRYAKDQESNPDDLSAFLETMAEVGMTADWALCAFGHSETDCLQAAFQNGGKARVGIENSLWNKDGSLARDNAERVAEISSLLNGKST